MIEIPTWFRWTFEFLWGILWGSFLNVCIYRLPREQSLVHPRSRCTRCHRQIAWHDNIPLLSFALLRGACRHCHKPIRRRYPLVELLTGLMTIAVLERFGLTPIGAIDLAFVYGLIVVSFIDLEFQIIPDEISVGGRGLGVLLSLLVPALHGTTSHVMAAGYAVLGVFVGGGLLYATGLVGDLIFRKESMGGGDIKLLAMAGSILGWKMVTLAFFLAPMLALIPGLFVLLFKRSHVIPYGPFLSLALILAMFFGPAILQASGVEESVSLLWGYYTGRVY